MKVREYFTVIFVLSVCLCVGLSLETSAQSDPGKICIDCHSQANIMPGLYNQYLKSRHYKHKKTCYDCHKAKQGEPGAFEHNGQWISVVVSPKDCEGCHANEVKEFNQSMHAKARRLITHGCGRIVRQNIVSTQYPLPGGEPLDKVAGGVNACLRCHGSKIKIGDNGRPTPGTWPNSGIGRINPDGSVGNCAACHESHEFSVTMARQPESCAYCHNTGGGDPQYRAYLQSRHGMTYYAKKDQMNLGSKSWVVGKDYDAAPTCVTCHMGAAPEAMVQPGEKLLPVLKFTHNINSRLDWNPLLQRTNTLAILQKGGAALQSDYKQPPTDIQHWYNMRQVCLACHAKPFADNFKVQYEAEVSLFERKWLIPGKHLFALATKILKIIEGKKYALFTHPVDNSWFQVANSDAKDIHTGAAMMSPGNTELGAGGAGGHWLSFMGDIKTVISNAQSVIDGKLSPLQKIELRYRQLSKKELAALQAALDALKAEYIKILKNPVYYGPWPQKKK